jgi:hypothetical protein
MPEPPAHVCPWCQTSFDTLAVLVLTHLRACQARQATEAEIKALTQPQEGGAYGPTAAG